MHQCQCRRRAGRHGPLADPQLSGINCKESMATGYGYNKGQGHSERGGVIRMGKEGGRAGGRGAELLGSSPDCSGSDLSLKGKAHGPLFYSYCTCSVRTVIGILVLAVFLRCQTCTVVAFSFTCSVKLVNTVHPHACIQCIMLSLGSYRGPPPRDAFSAPSTPSRKCISCTAATVAGLLPRGLLPKESI